MMRAANAGPMRAVEPTEAQMAAHFIAEVPRVSDPPGMEEYRDVVTFLVGQCSADIENVKVGEA